jgi:hypothetical protein
VAEFLLWKIVALYNIPLMKKLFLSLTLTLCIYFLSAQDTVMLRYMSTITAAELSGHVHTLASPQFEGRYTGSEGQRMAAEYIR